MIKMLKEKREALGLTQKNIADSLGVHTQTVWYWEKGLKHPNTKFLSKIKELYHLSDIEIASIYLNEQGDD